MDENQEQVIARIKSLIKKWDDLSKLNHRGIAALGITAIVGTLFVSTFIGTNEIIPNWLLKTISCLSSVCLALIAAFNMVANRNKYRNAWRLLNSKYLLFQAGYIDLQELLHYYERAEEMIGNLNFSYNHVIGQDSEHSATIAAKNELEK